MQAKDGLNLYGIIITAFYFKSFLPPFSCFIIAAFGMNKHVN